MSIQARPLSFADQVCQHNKKPTKLKRMLDEMEKVIPWKKIMVMIERDLCTTPKFCSVYYCILSKSIG